MLASNRQRISVIKMPTYRCPKDVCIKRFDLLIIININNDRKNMIRVYINITLLRKKNEKETRGKRTVCSNFAVLRAAVFEPVFIPNICPNDLGYPTITVIVSFYFEYTRVYIYTEM